jgi:hypothetical protein
MTFIVSTDYRGDRDNRATILDMKMLRSLRLRSGDPLAGRFPPDLKVVISAGGAVGDWFYVGSMLVVSQKMRQVLDRFGVQAEWFPISLEFKETGIAPGIDYYYLNILGIVDSLDRSRSTFTPEGEYATDLRKVSLRPVDDEPPLYLVAKAIPSLVCVRDDVASEIRSAGIRGVLVERDVDWRTPTLPRP